MCVCLSVCMYFKKKLYILLPCCITIGYIIYWIHCYTTIKIVAQQLKQVQLFTLLKPLVGNSLNQADGLNQAWPYVETAIR
jgi:hypothetical protein